MSNVLKRYLMLTLCIAFIPLVVGCSGKNALIGTWQSEQGDNIEFFKDGTVIIEDQIFSVAGKYAVIDNNRMRIELEGIWGISGSHIANYEVSGSRLVIDGIVYKKVR